MISKTFDDREHHPDPVSPGIDGREARAEPTPEAVAQPEPAGPDVEEAKEKLVDFVLSQTENPVDHWAVAATLESRGMRDVDAVEKFGKGDIFDLATEIYARCRKRLRLEELAIFVLDQADLPLTRQDVLTALKKRGIVDREAVVHFGQASLADLADTVYARCQARLAETEAQFSPRDSWAARLGYYVQDVVLAAPMVIFLSSVGVLAYAWWTYFYLSRELATSLALGTIASFLVGGGFVKAISRMGRFHLLQGSHALPRETISRLLQRGVLAALIVGLVGSLAWIITGLVALYYLPQLGRFNLGQSLITLGYYLFLAGLWLVLAALYTLRQRLAVVMVAGGLVASLLLATLLPELFPLHWLALGVTTGLAWWWWRQQPPWPEKEIEAELKWAKLPRPSFLSYTLAPFLVYGLLYGTYLGLAGFNGWLVGRQPWPLTAWFRLPYPTGLNLIVPLLAFVFFLVLALMVTILLLEKAIYGQKPVLAIEAPERIGRFLKFYLQGTVFAVPMAVQVFSVIIFGFGLWASMDFSEEAATTVAIGTILCFVVTGGFVQSIGRLGQFYHEQDMHLLVKQVAYRIMRSGIKAMLVVGMGWYVINLLIPHFPQRVILVSLAYYFLLASLWLFLAVLYTLQRRVAIVNVVIIGLVVIGLVLYYFTPWGGVHPLAGWMATLVHFLSSQAPPWLAQASFWLLGTAFSISNWLGMASVYQEATWDIYAAHWIGLTVANLAAFVWGHRKLFGPAYELSRQTDRTAIELQRAKLPRPSLLTYSVTPYFVYGTLYFTFLFMDRVIGWSAGQEPLPMIIWFRTPYELGLDWALLSMLLTIAMLEYTIHEFGSVIIPVQEQRKALQIETVENHVQERKEKQAEQTDLDKVTVTPHPLNAFADIAVARQFKNHNRFFFKFYIRQLLLLAGISIASILVTYYGVLWLRRFDDVKAIRDFFANPITFWVFYWSVVGYALLVWGMLNSVFFFFLSRPWFTIRTAGLVLVVNIVVGFVLSRMFAYWYSVIGLTVGALIFAIIMTWYAIKVFRKLDYYYYSAY